ncbi:hypothetical protein JTE90_028673 [Oedothorax gibbosus]|uniref:Uncharacterized protein n=1 Tax=Oedothorax gibbosus TaxID=931172 RepID=A0AAV6TQU6_9ARAC|nr:hypothetical protein JTE90_014545 [Oedothorax gibbosus]KAG8173792.1 hypothetical protein JTE90_028673 [Oedothorax gibbosus]
MKDFQHVSSEQESQLISRIQEQKKPLFRLVQIRLSTKSNAYESCEKTRGGEEQSTCVEAGPDSRQGSGLRAHETPTLYFMGCAVEILREKSKFFHLFFPETQ